MKRTAWILGLTLLCLSGLGAEAPASVTGTWLLKYEKTTSTVELVQAGDKLTGKISSDPSSSAPVTGQVQGNSVKFGVPKELTRNSLVPQFEGTVSGATMSGKVKIGPARLPFTGTKTK